MNEDENDLMAGQDENDYSTIATPAAVNQDELPSNLEPGQPIIPTQPGKP